MDIWVDSKFVGGVSELTLLTPIKRGTIVGETRTYEQRLHEHLKSVQQRIDEGIVTSVSHIATIHFARWQILLPAHYLHYSREAIEAAGRKIDDFPSWLLFTSNFDGDLKTYLNEFSGLIAKDVDRIWSNCEGYPEEGCQNFDAYWAYAKKHQITTQAFFNAYPGLSVPRIRELTVFRERFDAFVASTRAADGSSVADLPARFDAFLSHNLTFPENFPAAGGIFEAPAGNQDRPTMPGTVAVPSTDPALLHDLQTGVARGVDAPLVAYLFFRITDRDAFVKQLPDGKASVPGLGIAAATFCSEASRLADAATALANIAFTYSGLAALGVDATTLGTFPEPFREGMAHRAVLLGDHEPPTPELWKDYTASHVTRGPASPELWEGYLGSREIHGVAWASFQFPETPTANAIAELFEKLRAALGGTPLDGVIPLGTGADGDPIRTAAIAGAEVLHVELGFANYKYGPKGEPLYSVEHFGFRDGISRSLAEVGLPAPAGATEPLLARGELLLGYPDEQDSPQLLPSNQTLRDNGTYMVFRKLEQDVAAFRKFAEQHELPGGKGSLAAQMVGRRQDGSPLVQGATGSAAPSQQTLNGFGYRSEDPKGLQCPIGAHIRRVNPRDTNGREKQARRHRLFRRGIAYGGPLLPEGCSGDGTPRGLLFVSLQARIDRQFEFVQARWMNGAEFSGQAGAHLDPLTGAHAGRVRDAFHPAGRPAPITGLPRFVTLRGGDYFFVPSFTALAAMKANDRFAPDPESKSPRIEPALGVTLPSTSDDSEELVREARKLLCRGDAFIDRPTVMTRRSPAEPLREVKTILVARHALVKAVLEDHKSFSSILFHDSGATITGGRGMLVGLPEGCAERQKRLAVLKAGMTGFPSVVDPARLAALARILAEAVIGVVGPLGRLDVVSHFGRVVPIRFVGELFGVVGPNAISPTAIAAYFARTGPDEEVPDDWRRTLPEFDKPLYTMQVWMRLTFLQVFLNLPHAEEATKLGKAAADELLGHIESLLAAARETPGACAAPRTLLEALARVPLDAADQPDPKRHARLLLAELAAATVETVNAALANAVNYVLDNRQKVKRAIRRHLKLGSADTSSLGELIGQLSDPEIDALIREILRFDPMGPISFRTAMPGATIDGNPIAPLTNVALAPGIAMLDPTVFPDPDEIDLARPPCNYLHFGTGLHACRGQHLAEPLLREMFRAIVTLPRLRRAAGNLGSKRQRYPLLIDGLTVRFDPT